MGMVQNRPHIMSDADADKLFLLAAMEPVPEDRSREMKEMTETLEFLSNAMDNIWGFLNKVPSCDLWAAAFVYLLRTALRDFKNAVLPQRVMGT